MKYLNTILLSIIAIVVCYLGFSVLRVELAARKVAREVAAEAERIRIQDSLKLAKEKEDKAIMARIRERESNSIQIINAIQAAKNKTKDSLERIERNRRISKRNKEIKATSKYKYMARIYNNYDSTICYLKYSDDYVYQVQCSSDILSQSEGRFSTGEETNLPSPVPSYERYLK